MTMLDKAKDVIARGAITEAPVRYFPVKSGDKIYNVLVIDKGDDTPAISCDCEAGRHEQKCYHALAALMLVRASEGDVEVDELKLTRLERSTLTFAAGSIAEDIDEYGLSGVEKAAYGRAMKKIRGR